MQNHSHSSTAGLLIGVAAFILTILIGCQRPYSPAVYRKQNETQLYAMICHDNKRTLRVPSEEWEAHKAHGDYRGPCRTRKLAGDKKPKEVKNTSISFDDAKHRSDDSYERWAAKEALKNAYIDSLKAVHEAAPK